MGGLEEISLWVDSLLAHFWIVFLVGLSSQEDLVQPGPCRGHTGNDVIYDGKICSVKPLPLSGVNSRFFFPFVIGETDDNNGTGAGCVVLCTRATMAVGRVLDGQT